jgi:hypothetical protein
LIDPKPDKLMPGRSHGGKRRESDLERTNVDFRIMKMGRAVKNIAVQLKDEKGK